MIRVAIFDDNRDQRDALAVLFSTVSTLDCVGLFSDANNVVRDVESCTPDVVLMDIDMPGTDGIKATYQLHNKFPSLHIIMLTVMEDDTRVFSAIRAGADGYFLKQTAPMKLIEGIVSVTEGGAPMSPTIARKVLKLVEHNKPVKVTQEFNLTPRETEILAHLVKGWTYKRIATELGISFATVNKHVSNVYSKLHVQSVGEAVALAVRKGLA